MATVAKKKTKSVGQVAYLTKQVESLEKDLIRKDIEKLDQKVDSVKTELITKVDNLEKKVDTKIDNLENKIDWLKWIVGGGLTALLSIMLYLHSDTNKRFDKIDKRFDKIERVIENINQKLK